MYVNLCEIFIGDFQKYLVGGRDGVFYRNLKIFMNKQDYKLVKFWLLFKLYYLYLFVDEV